MAWFVGLFVGWSGGLFVCLFFGCVLVGWLTVCVVVGDYNMWLICMYITTFLTRGLLFITYAPTEIG